MWIVVDWLVFNRLSIPSTPLTARILAVVQLCNDWRSRTLGHNIPLQSYRQCWEWHYCCWRVFPLVEICQDWNNPYHHQLDKPETFCRPINPNERMCREELSAFLLHLPCPFPRLLYSAGHRTFLSTEQVLCQELHPWWNIHNTFLFHYVRKYQIGYICSLLCWEHLQPIFHQISNGCHQTQSYCQILSHNDSF